MFINLEVEIFEEDGKNLVFLSNDGSSGCEYEFHSKDELKSIISRYVDDMLYDYPEIGGK